MQLFFVFSFPHGLGMRFEGCLFFFRLYLSSNSNDKPRTPVILQKSKIQRSRRKRAERGRLRFWCLLEALKLVKTLWKWSQGTGLVMRIPKITLGSQNGGQTAEWRPIENRQFFAKLEFGNGAFNLVWRPSYATFFHFLFFTRSGNEI